MTEQNMTDPNVSVETMKTASAEATPVAPAAEPATPLTMLPQYAMTPKRGTSRKPKKEPAALLAYAIEVGGRIELTDETKRALEARGLKPHRIPNAIYDVRKYFGRQVETERQGRAVRAYTITL